MENHPTAVNRSVEFCVELFSRVYGRAQIRVNGQMPCFDPARKEVFIDDNDEEFPTVWMPAGAFQQNLTSEEINSLVEMGAWDGNNGLFMTTTTLQAINFAVRRYRKRKIKSSHTEDSANFFLDSQFFVESVMNNVIVRTPAH